jgi:hypothetical protein
MLQRVFHYLVHPVVHLIFLKLLKLQFSGLDYWSTVLVVLNFSWCTNLPFTNIIPAAPTLSPVLLPSVYTTVVNVRTSARFNSLATLLRID